MRRILQLCIMTVLWWGGVGCTTTPDTTLRLSITGDRRDILHTLTITVSDATTSSGQAVAGRIVITRRQYDDTNQYTIASTGTVTPRWLTPFGGTLTVVTKIGRAHV